VDCCGDIVCTLAELEAGGYIQNDSLLVKVVFGAAAATEDEDLASLRNQEWQRSQ
jgi:hypothetical protein